MNFAKSFSIFSKKIWFIFFLHFLAPNCILSKRNSKIDTGYCLSRQCKVLGYKIGKKEKKYIPKLKKEIIIQRKFWLSLWLHQFFIWVCLFVTNGSSMSDCSSDISLSARILAEPQQQSPERRVWQAFDNCPLKTKEQRF